MTPSAESPAPKRTRIHVKVGTHPATYAVLLEPAVLKVGSRITAKDDISGSEPVIGGIITEARDVGNDEPLYFVERM